MFAAREEARRGTPVPTLVRVSDPLDKLRNEPYFDELCLLTAAPAARIIKSTSLKECGSSPAIG